MDFLANVSALPPTVSWVGWDATEATSLVSTGMPCGEQRVRLQKREIREGRRGATQVPAETRLCVKDSALESQIANLCANDSSTRHIRQTKKRTWAVLLGEHWRSSATTAALGGKAPGHRDALRMVDITPVGPRGPLREGSWEQARTTVTGTCLAAGAVASHPAVPGAKRARGPGPRALAVMIGVLSNPQCTQVPTSSTSRGARQLAIIEANFRWLSGQPAPRPCHAPLNGRAKRESRACEILRRLPVHVQVG